LPDDDIVRLGVKHSFQDWMVAKWSDQIGNEVEQLLQSLNTSASTTLRVNTLKASREECRERLRTEGIETEPTKHSPVGLIAAKRFNTHASQAFKDGWYEVQDEGSQLISFLVAPKPGDIVVDGAAGAGGKSLHLAELMKNVGEIVAIDIDARRLRELEIRAGRGGIEIIRTTLKEKMQPENYFGKADIVLVDAPCSGVGTIRRNPWLKWSITESLVEHYARIQTELLEFNAQFVKPGGCLIYSTCSLFQQENDDVVDSFLKSHSTFQPINLHDQISQFDLSSESRYLTLYTHRHGTDGFFVAMMGRVKDIGKME
jgi:16S rRNA (cytosine967-C5)-methyltransferase